MKTLREENFFGPFRPGESYYLEEPAWRDDNGEPQFTVEGAPKGRPTWDVGDLVVLFVGGLEHTAGMLEVASAPYESGKADWPWMTDAQIVGVDGPTLDALGVPHDMVKRRVRWRLAEDQALRARRAFGV
jgi:hypothetical protein